ncbi:hypothetical protein INT48_002616 [Thamnidium elegans]|uniref:Uncharacterized protein n=1 Tax=Thamnidium elegans TaxID=101142 RepID=A0A8H7SVW7_9FUNG|nr:hypothetical protein INT48_002616 [Thamnidium elegans]
MNQHKWSTDTFEVFEKPKMKDSFVTASNNNSPFNLTAKAFIPTNSSRFDPFQPLPETKSEEEDLEDDMTDLMHAPILWDTQKEWKPSNNKIQDIWTQDEKEHDNFESFSQQGDNHGENYSHSDDQEFDPTLQFYHGSLYDSHTIQDMNRLSLDVTNPSLEETEAENVGEDMSTLQMMQTIFSDLSDEQLMETLARHDYDVDRAIESLLTKETTVEPAPTVKKRQVCRHFLAGECYRKDCWFVHDLQEKIWTCLKGDSCEFSHKIDVQEVANKIIVPQPVVRKEPQHHQFTPGDYPQLSNQSCKPYHSTNVKQQPEEQVIEDEFPSLASASKIKKPPQSLIKGGSSINFAAAAKKKGSPKSNIQTKKAIRRTGYHNTQKLTQPVHIPWLDTGSALNSVYMKEREQAIEYGMLRNRFFSRATDYYLKGDGAKAKLYSMEAKKYNRLMQEMHTEASKRIFESRSQHEAFIDLHGLHEDEAIEIIDQRLKDLKAKYSGVIYIVTGTGHHSGANGLSKKQSKLKPSVYNYLKKENYRFAETNIVGDSKGGVFAVDLS